MRYQGYAIEETYYANDLQKRATNAALRKTHYKTRTTNPRYKNLFLSAYMHYCYHYRVQPVPSKVHLGSGSLQGCTGTCSTGWQREACRLRPDISLLFFSTTNPRHSNIFPAAIQTEDCTERQRSGILKPGCSSTNPYPGFRGTASKAFYGPVALTMQ